MSHKKAAKHNKANKQKIAHALPEQQPVKTPPKLELVLKCDSPGSLEAIMSAIYTSVPTEVRVSVFHSGIGPITKSDIFMAETGSRLIIGFEVDIPSQTEHLLEKSGVEIRTYDIIYKLVDDVKTIAQSLIPQQQQENETILGEAEVIALFKSCRHGIILGCEVTKGSLSINQQFRIITAMGPVHTGVIKSLHIEKNVVKSARSGQQVGLKIENFDKVHIGDKVESFQPVRAENHYHWSPSPHIIHCK